MVFFIFCGVITVAWIGLIIWVYAGLTTIALLKAQPPADTHPSIDIVIAVRNEEENLEKALISVCNLQYDNYCIIVVNDRSTDRTGEILRQLKEQYPTLEITTIDQLPPDWMGKNHALYKGYQSSTAEWILFTDADIEFQPDALNRAMSYALNHQLDHLTILPDVVSRSPALNVVLGTFTLMLHIHLKPWLARNPRSKAFIGIGAFNLVKRTAYEQAGTHSAIKLRPDDDVQLGKLIKSAGLRQDVLKGDDYLSLEWYSSIAQFVNGLMKNSFAVAEYKPLQAAINLFNILAGIALPVPLMLIFGTTAERLMALVVLIAQAFFMHSMYRGKWWHALLIPFSGLLMAYITAKAALITLKQGGIYWRGTFYPLQQLKQR